MRARICFFVVLAGCSKMDVAAYPGSGPAAMERAAAPMLVVDDPGTWKRSTLPVHASRVRIGDSRELPLERVDMRVEVAGYRARVGLEFVFANPDDQVHEGTFQMRLADDASPHRLAFGQTELDFTRPLGPPGPVAVPLDATWGQLREARVVPRRTASTAYDETVNPRDVRVVVDPALAEWAGAGVFNMRVFPISPRRHHKVVFEYDVDMVPSGPDLALELPAPANVPETWVRVAAPEGARVVPAAPPTSGDGTNHYIYQDLREPLSLRVPNRPVIMHWQDEQAGLLFATRVVPQLPEAQPAEARPRAIFAVDTSLSSNPVRYNVWLALLREVLNSNRDVLREFAVVYFNVETRWWQPRFVANTPDNVAAALGFANTLALAGATDIGAALDQAAAPPWPAQGTWDVFLLSDGAATWGEDDLIAAGRRFAADDCGDGGCPGRLVAYRTHGVGVDPRLLGQLVRETGGTLIAVEGEASAGRVATAHRRTPWQLADVQVEFGEDVVVAGRPQTVSAGQPLVVVGRGQPPSESKLRLKLRQGSAERTVELGVGPAVRSPLAARAYGQVAVEQLEEHVSTRAEAEAFGQHFAVPGEACSLLMLESEEDYARYGLSGRRSDPQVLRTHIRGVIAGAAARADAEGTDPRPALLRTLRGDGRVNALIQTAPLELLRVPSAPLATKSSGWRDIPVVLRPQLEKQAIDEVLLRGHAAEVKASRGAPDGLKVLSSLAEVRPGDAPLLRGLAYTALAWDLPEAAYHLLHRASELAPREAADDHWMGVALARLGRAELAVARFEAALADPGRRVDSAAAADYRRFLGQAGQLARGPTAAFMQQRLVELGTYQTPLLVTVHWSGDHADVDLHVIEPGGADCHYGNQTTPIGALEVDASDGHGPETYRASQAAPGRYQIAAKLFSGTRHRVSTRMQALVSVYRDVGGSNETVTRHAVTLEPGRVPTPVTEVVLP